MALAPYGSPHWQLLTAGFAKNSLTLAQFAATTSLELKNLVTDETGSGALGLCDLADSGVASPRSSPRPRAQTLRLPLPGKRGRGRSFSPPAPR